MYFSHLDKLQVNDFTIYLQKGAFSKIFRNIATKHILLATIYHHIHYQGLISAGCSRAWLEGEGRESGGDGNATPSWRSASAQRKGSAEAVAQRAREIDSISR